MAARGTARAGSRAARSWQLAVAAKGTFTLHTMGFKKADDEADDGTTTSGLIKSSILTTSLSARIAAPSEIRKGIGRLYPLLNEKIPGAGAPWTPLESLGALRAPRIGASRLLQLD